jgi:hypothetical protein
MSEENGSSTRSNNNDEQQLLLKDDESDELNDSLLPQDVTTTTDEPALVQLPAAATAVETPSTSNKALILQIKILSEYAKDIHRSTYAVANAGGFHREHVRRRSTTS